MRLHRHTDTVHAGCAAAVIVAVSVFTTAAGAQDMPRQGEFRITYTSTNPAAAKPVTIGDNRTAAAGITMMTAVNETGGKLLHNMAGRCTGAPVIDNSAKTLENHGYCDYVDADGDHVYEKYDYPLQPQGVSLEATGEWLGGTGKFAGLSGTIQIHSRRLNSLVEGATQVVGEKVGRYSFQNTMATK